MLRAVVTDPQFLVPIIILIAGVILLVVLS